MITQAIRQNFTVQRDHHVDIHAPELKRGDQVEVILLVQPKTMRSQSLHSLLGTGKGSFASPEEADRFIRQERNQWE